MVNRHGNGLCKRNKIKRILDLNKDTCPNREQKANGTNVYYGKASELLNDAKQRNIKIPDRKFQQSGGCVLNFYLSNRVTTIRDGVTHFKLSTTFSKICSIPYEQN